MPSCVTLHIYHVGNSSHVDLMNKYLQALGTGAFHGAVEVYGREFSYGFMPRGTGVFDCAPKQCASHRYWKSQPIGVTELSKVEVRKILLQLKRDWRGAQYDLLRRNCCTFSNEFCMRLGVGPVPTWVTNLAAAGATLTDGVLAAATAAHAAAILGAAMAGEVDRKYSTGGTARARAQDYVGNCVWRCSDDDVDGFCVSTRNAIQEENANLSDCWGREAPQKTKLTFQSEPWTWRDARDVPLKERSGVCSRSWLAACIFGGRMGDIDEREIPG